MTKMAEQEIKDTLKKSEFRGMIATVISTATIIVSLFFGGNEIINSIKESLRLEVKAEIKEQLNDFKVQQAKKDAEQDEQIKYMNATSMPQH